MFYENSSCRNRICRIDYHYCISIASRRDDVDIIEDKVNKINNRINPNQDEYIERYPKEKELNLTATLNANQAYKVVVFLSISL